MPTTRLFLIRHGETSVHREFRSIGSSDEALSPAGENQAGQLGEALARLPIAAVYSSPLQSSRATATAIARLHRLEVQATPELRECYFGSWEGLSREEVQARSPADAALLQQWARDPNVAPPGGESFAILQRRVCTFVDRLAAQYSGQALALVSHVGPIKVLLAAALIAPLSASFRIFLDPATISVVDWQPGGLAQVRLVNSHAHLGWMYARWM